MDEDADLQLHEDDEVPDYRSDRMESAEGKGIAEARISAFYENCDNHDLAEAFPVTAGAAPPDDVWADVAQEARERSECIGFWVAWHQAGGFKALEYRGWHRATIFRKIRRFRAIFGTHPDQWRCDWITLDLERYWRADMDVRIAVRRGDLDPDVH